MMTEHSVREISLSDGLLMKSSEKEFIQVVSSSAPTSSKSKEEQPIFLGLKKKTVNAPHLRPAKFSSTSSLFLDSTISKPKNAELVRCMAEYFHTNIHPSASSTLDQKKAFEVFDETLHPLVSKIVDSNIPDSATLERFIKNIFKIGQLAPESLLMGVAYIERIMKAGFKLYPFNYKRIILSALILASKVWEDQAVWNVDFLEIFPLATPNDLGQLEKKLLSMLQFDVSLKASDYARIYFDLRAQSPATEDHFVELKPLTKDGEATLELKTSNFTAKQNKQLYRSSGSVDDIASRSSRSKSSPRVILN